jgi:DNA-binding MarR family transcriptional regulator
MNVDALLDLDRVVHEPARLAMLTVLANADEVSFAFMEKVTGLSKGNLSSHSTKLEAAGYIEVVKGFEGRKPYTHFRITEQGRAALAGYWASVREALPPQEG